MIKGKILELEEIVAKQNNRIAELTEKAKEVERERQIKRHGSAKSCDQEKHNSEQVKQSTTSSTN